MRKNSGMWKNNKSEGKTSPCSADNLWCGGHCACRRILSICEERGSRPHQCGGGPAGASSLWAAVSSIAGK